MVNAVCVKGNMLGDVMFYGAGAGKLPTASAVVSDIVVPCVMQTVMSIMAGHRRRKNSYQ